MSNLKSAAWAILVIGGLLCFMLYLRWSEEETFKKGTKYCRGVITGFSKGAKGSNLVDYAFSVKNINYKGWATRSYCYTDGHKGCNIGDSVYVAYAIVDPKTNELLFELPVGKKFDSVYH